MNVEDTMESDVISRVAEALRKLERIPRSLNGSERLEQGAKIRYLERMRERAEENRSLDAPEVFVSFTSEIGREIMLAVIRQIDKRRVPGTNRSFHARHGMDLAPRGRARVLDHIITRMRPCCIFVGILTKDWNIDGTNEGAPGGWTLIEAGMALGLGLEVVFFLQEGISERFWRPFAGHVRHIRFK